MQAKNNLIVMLTRNDQTVWEAAKIFEQCRHSKAQFWGIKEVPLSLGEMKYLYSYMKECGKTTFLEVVEYAEDAGLLGAKTALECGCDILMGTRFFNSINQFCKEHKIKYMPFVGRLQGRPTVLTGQIEDIVAEAQEYAAKGVYGINLLGYRYAGNANRLNEEVVKNVSIPVCLAGSINSYQRLDEVKAVSPWAFTIGSAFFENKFSGSISEQIDKVYEYMQD